MKNFRCLLGWLIALGLLAFGARIVYSQEKAPASGTVQVHMVITDQAVRDDSEIPILRPENLQVRQGNTLLKIDTVIPARGDNAALQFFVLIDDTCDSSIGNVSTTCATSSMSSPQQWLSLWVICLTPRSRSHRTSLPIML